MAQVLVIGDDLTGSNATGALYARQGLRAVTVGDLDRITRYADRVDVLVVNTASRHWSPARAYAAVRAAADTAGEAPLTVKRVDTTLRGNPGSELDAVVDALAAREPTARIRTLAVPAFPDAGRTTVGGLHLVDGVPLTRTAVAHDPFDPVRHARVAAVLGTQSGRSTAELALDVVERGPSAVAAALRASPADIVVCDATENAHLRTVAAAAARLATEDRVRWVALDSGPFGPALATEMGLRPEGGAPATVLAVVGSVTGRTRTQLARTETALGARWAELDPAAPDPDRVLTALRAAAGEGATVLGVRVAAEPPTAVPDPRTAARILRALADKGLVGGIFFVGYVFLQIPAAILAQRWSARKTVLILMVAWGLAASLSGLVQTKSQFYAARFVLGFFEGGVWPAVLILLASWFPLRERARANALWMACLPLSSVFMAPLSGWMLDHASWRWVLVLQGVPPLVWAVVWWFAVADRPAQARWISRAEAAHVERSIAADEAAKPPAGSGSYLDAVKQKPVLVLIGVYFFWITGFYGFNLWLPSVIKELTHDGSSTEVGLLTAIPFTVALAVMIANAAWSDRTGRRRRAVAVPLVVGIAALLLGQAVDGALPRMLLLCVTAAAVYAPYGPFWAIPGQLLRFEVVAVAMGLINALGNLGGFAGPYLVGWLTDTTGSSVTGFAVLSGFLAVAVALVTLGLRTGTRPVGRPSEPAVEGA